MMTRLLARKLVFACWDISGVYSTYLCHIIPVNRPESGGTVPISTTVSRCPAEHSICPEFIRRRSVCFLPRVADRAHETKDTHALFCCHTYMSSEDFLYGYAGECVTRAHAIWTHTERMFSVGFLRARAIFVPILVEQMVPLCDSLIGVLHYTGFAASSGVAARP